MKYKNYEAKIEFDNKANIFHGEVLNINDTVTFQGSSVNELEKEFKKSVKYYLDLCKRNKVEPQKPFSGKFVLRISPEIHQKIFIAAQKAKKSLNSFAGEVLTKALL